MHGVVDRHTSGHRATRRVDIQVNVLVGIFRLKEQELRHDQIGHVVFHLTHEEDHALFQQSRVDIVGALPTGRLLDHHRDQAAGGLHFWGQLHKAVLGHGSL